MFIKTNLQHFGVISRLLTLFCITFLLVNTTNLRGQNSSTDEYTRYSVKNNAVQDLVPRLKSVLKDFGFEVEILVDPNSNSLAVKGDLRAQRMAGQLLQTLDKAPVAPKPTPVADPPTIRGYQVAAGELDATVQHLQRYFARTPNIRVAPDRRTNQVIVIASEQVQRAAAEAIRNPTRPNTPERTISSTTDDPTHQLKNMTWPEFEGALRNILGGQLTASTDSTGNHVTVKLPGPQGTSAEMKIDRRNSQITMQGDNTTSAAWLRVAAALDKTSGNKDDRTGIIPVKKADPDTVQDAVSLVQNATTSAAGDQAAVQFVPSANRQKWGGDLVSSIFQDRAEPDKPADTEPETEGNDGELGSTVLRVEPEEAGLIGTVQIEFIEGLGVFIIKGHRNDVQRVIEIIEQIEQHTDDTQPYVMVHPLIHVNSNVLAALVEDLYDDVFGSRNSPVSITALDKPNSILLIGREESMQAILDLIDKLDQPVPPSTQLKFFQLEYMSALDAERQIRDFYTNQPGSDEEVRPGLGVRPRIIADYRTNSLVINASPRDLAEIALLIERLDVEDSVATNQLRVFRLKNALAADLQPVLTEAITGISTANQGGGAQGQANATATISPQSSKLEILSISNEGESKVNSGILAGATVTADENVNALVVRAPATAMPLIEELITQLDQLPNAEAQIKVFQVENGDAINLTQLLQELFGLQVTAGSNAATNAFNTALQGTGGIGGGESSLVPLRFAVDQRTNSVIASGSSNDLEIVELLLIRLDEGDIQNRRTEVIRLENADASTVGPTLQTYVNTQRQLLTQSVNQQSSITNAEIIETQVVIGFDALSNSIILSAPPRNFETLKQIIKDLDFKPNMVMIQVVVAEVDLRDGFEFGVELGLQDSMLFDRGSAIGYNFQGQALGNDTTAASLASREDLAAQGIAGFGMGRSSASLGYGGLVFSAANESINILLRTLQDRGRVQILSRPQIMTLDMASAFVQVGANVTRITGSSTNQFGGITNTTEDVPIGLLLNVRPRVTPDGRIVMELSTEKSELGPPDTGTAVGVTPDGQAVLSAPIETTTAQTVISAHDGETVVFAGLITKNRLVNRRSVPYLGDIPMLGQLFRYDTETEERTELLIIMTPHIIKGEDDLDRLKAMESDRMSWLLSDIVELHGDVGLEKGKGLWGNGANVVYPDDNPAGTLLEHAFPTKPLGSTLGMDDWYGSTTATAPTVPVSQPDRRSVVPAPQYRSPSQYRAPDPRQGNLLPPQTNYTSPPPENRVTYGAPSNPNPLSRTQNNQYAPQANGGNLQRTLPTYPPTLYSQGSTAYDAARRQTSADAPPVYRDNTEYQRTAYPQNSGYQDFPR